MFVRAYRSLLAGAGAAVLAGSVLIGLIGGPAQAAPTADRADAAVGWLARLLVDGKHFGDPAFPDHGLTVDAIFAFAAAGSAKTYADNAIEWLDDPAVLAAFVGRADHPDVPGFSAGGTAKVILAAEVTGRDPTSFGGSDLVARLVSLQLPSGRFRDSYTFNGEILDQSNAFGQTLAIIALHRQGGQAAATTLALEFLLATQCDDGGFPLTFELDPSDDPACDSQVDSTAMAIQALLAVGDTETAAEGLTWLLSKQKDDGGFDDDNANDDQRFPENTNSTGLAAEALRVGGKAAAADEAVAYIADLQVGCDGAAGDRGAIAYSAEGFNSFNAPRATAQAVLGLTGIGLAALTTTGAGAGADTLDCVAPTTSTSTSTGTTTTTTTTTTTSSSTTSTTQGGSLPVTGASLPPLLFGGSALVVVGAGLLVVLRLRRRAEDG